MPNGIRVVDARELAYCLMHCQFKEISDDLIIRRTGGVRNTAEYSVTLMAGSGGTEYTGTMFDIVNNILSDYKRDYKEI